MKGLVKMIFKNLKKKIDRPTKQDIQELKDYYNELTAELSHEWALEKLDSERRCHYLMLLKIADFEEMGKTFSILTAFKMGYLYAQDKVKRLHGKQNTK